MRSRPTRGVALSATLGILIGLVAAPVDVQAFGTFRQDQRINQLTLQFTTDSFATKNAYGSAFAGGTIRSNIQVGLTAGIGDGTNSLLFEMPGLTDLTGTTQASLNVGVVNGLKVSSPTAYNGSSDLDWWYSPRPADVDAGGVPKSQLTGSIVSKTLNATGSAIPFLTNLGNLTMAGVQITASVGGTSKPATASGYFPPGYPASEQIDPSLQSFTSMSAGRLKGNFIAASLAATPIPTALIGTGPTNCSQAYTVSNTMLDLLVAGCSTILGTQVASTQPDTVNAAAPPAGAGGLYTLFAPTGHRVSQCKDKNNVIVPNLSTCLNAATYSAYFTFTTDRVIGKGPQVISFTSTPPAGPVVGGTYNATASNVVVFSADAASNPSACTVSSGGLVNFIGPGTCIVDANRAGDNTHLAAAQVSQSMTVTATRIGATQSTSASPPSRVGVNAGPPSSPAPRLPVGGPSASSGVQHAQPAPAASSPATTWQPHAGLPAIVQFLLALVGRLATG